MINFGIPTKNAVKKLGKVAFTGNTNPWESKSRRHLSSEWNTQKEEKQRTVKEGQSRETKRIKEGERKLWAGM